MVIKTVYQDYDSKMTLENTSASKSDLEDTKDEISSLLDREKRRQDAKIKISYRRKFLKKRITTTDSGCKLWRI